MRPIICGWNKAAGWWWEEGERRLKGDVTKRARARGARARPAARATKEGEMPCARLALAETAGALMYSIMQSSQGT